jgi:ribonuclease HI
MDKFYYAVHKGHIPGIYNKWSDCEKQIKKFVNAEFKKFASKEDAQNFVLNGFGVNKPKFIKKKETSDKKNNDKIEKECIEDESDKIYIYTDGSFIRSNGKTQDIAGYGIYIPSKNIKVGLPLINQKITNNRAELTAIIDSFKYLDESDLEKKICIFTDSQYSIYIMTGTGERYEKNGFKNNGKNVPNIDLIKKVLEIVRKYNIVVLKVRAHTNLNDIHSINNDIADKLANTGASMSPKKEHSFKDFIVTLSDTKSIKTNNDNDETYDSDEDNIESFIIQNKDNKDKKNTSFFIDDDNYLEENEEHITIFKNQCKKSYQNNENNNISPTIQMNQLFEMDALNDKKKISLNDKKIKKLSDWFIKK